MCWVYSKCLFVLRSSPRYNIKGERLTLGSVHPQTHSLLFLPLSISTATSFPQPSTAPDMAAGYGSLFCVGNWVWR